MICQENVPLSLPTFGTGHALECGNIGIFLFSFLKPLSLWTDLYEKMISRYVNYQKG